MPEKGEERAQGADLGRAQEQRICEKDEAGLYVDEPAVTPVPCTACMCDQSGYRSHIQTFSVQAWDYMVNSPLVFLYNAFMIFATFSIVYLFRRRVFARIIVSVLWLILGVCNGYMLIKRVTPFNAQDLKVAMDAVQLINNYFDPFELIMIAVGIVAVVVWIISMWRRGGSVHQVSFADGWQ